MENKKVKKSWGNIFQAESSKCKDPGVETSLGGLGSERSVQYHTGEMGTGS